MLNIPKIFMDDVKLILVTLSTILPSGYLLHSHGIDGP